METGRGILAVCNDVDPAHEDEFNRWYQRQHVPERLGVPGFLDARRYVAIEGGPKYCAFYRLADARALTDPVYRERLAHPTGWTRRTMPWFREMVRSICTVTIDRGHGIGGLLAWVSFSPRAAERAAARERVHSLLDPALADDGIVRAQLWENDASVTGAPNPEAALRPGGDRIADWIVTLEASTEAALARHAPGLAGGLRGERYDAVTGGDAIYRLMWRLEAQDRPVMAQDPR